MRTNISKVISANDLGVLSLSDELLEKNAIIQAVTGLSLIRRIRSEKLYD